MFNELCEGWFFFNVSAMVVSAKFFVTNDVAENQHWSQQSLFPHFPHESALFSGLISLKYAAMN